MTASETGRDEARKLYEHAHAEFPACGIAVVPWPNVPEVIRNAWRRALAEVRREERERQWIPVAERMPKKKDGPVVLVWDAEDRAPGLCSIDALTPDMPELTHWMPLPATPDAGGNR